MDTGLHSRSGEAIATGAASSGLGRLSPGSDAKTSRLWLGLARLAGAAALAAVSVLVALTACDRLVAYLDPGVAALRGEANTHRLLAQKEFAVWMRSNALGFRERRLPSPKPPGVVRVVALGDSFTQGYGVAASQAYTRHLESLLRRRDPEHGYEVVNLGVQGTNTLDHRRHLEEVGLAYQPDIVLVAVMANDVGDIATLRETGRRFLPEVMREARAAVLEVRPWVKRLVQSLWPALYGYAAQALARRAPAERRPTAAGERGELAAGLQATASLAAPPHDAAATAQSRWREILLELAGRYHRRADVEARLASLPPGTVSEIAPVLAGTYRHEVAPDQGPMRLLMAMVRPEAFLEMAFVPERHEAAWVEMEGALREIHRTARSAGARAVLIYIPAAFQVSPEPLPLLESQGFVTDPRTLVDTSFADRLRRFAGAEEIDFVDLLGPLRARARHRLYFPEDMHWTPAGHRLAAATIADAVAAP